MADLKCELYHDNFQNFKCYSIPKAQLVIADIPYNIGSDFYASRPDWYVDGEHYGDSVSFKVEEDGTVDFEFTLPDVQIRKYGTCEFRLWEADHAHVIAYVKLTKT